MEEFTFNYQNKRNGESKTYHLESLTSGDGQIRQLDKQVARICRQELLPTTQSSIMIGLSLLFLAFINVVSVNWLGLMLSCVCIFIVGTGYSFKKKQVYKEIEEQIKQQLQSHKTQQATDNIYFSQIEEAWNLKEKEGSLLRRSKEEYSEFRKVLNNYESQLLTENEKTVFVETEALLKQKMDNQQLIYEFIENWYNKLKVLEANQKANRFIQEYDRERENLPIEGTIDQIQDQDLYKEQIMEMQQIKELIVNKLRMENETEIVAKIKDLLDKK